jgi:hypothetical protein
MSRLRTTALAAASLLLSAAPARAYDLGDCNQLLATDAMQQFTMHGENVDFAADFMPFGRAAICWSQSSRVAVIGKLYASQFCGPFRPCDELEAIAKIKFQRTNGNWTKNYTYRVNWTSFSPAVEVKKIAPAGSYKKVRIRLYTFQHTDLGPLGPVKRADQTFTP